MLYLAGDTNLTEDMVLALQGLQAAGPPVDDKSWLSSTQADGAGDSAIRPQ